MNTTRKRFDAVMKTIASKEFLVVGDVGLDRYTIGDARRLNDEAPVPIVSVGKTQDKLGLAGNVADNIHALQGVPHLFSLVGKDLYGEKLLQLLKEKKISSQGVFPHPTRRTTLKERVIANNQQVVRIDYEDIQDLSPEEEAFFWKKLEPEIEKYSGIIIEDYSKGLLTPSLTAKIIQSARKKKKFVAVDPPSLSHRRHIEYYRGATLLTPNLKEAAQLSGIEIRDRSSLHKAGEQLLQELECEIVVITQGGEGMTVFKKNITPMQVPTFAHAVYDVSGAGDTVVAMLTMTMSNDVPLEESLLLANFAAGAEVGKMGTTTVSVEELREYVERIGGFSQ